jgi:hypothetical protein
VNEKAQEVYFPTEIDDDDFDPKRPCPTRDRRCDNHNLRMHEESAERLGEQLKEDGWL